MALRYRVIDKDDNQDKGSHGGSCNRKACQAPNAMWYNEATDSYYCKPCAAMINEVNKSCGRDICTYDADGSKEQ